MPAPIPLAQHQDDEVMKVHDGVADLPKPDRFGTRGRADSESSTTILLNPNYAGNVGRRRIRLWAGLGATLLLLVIIIAVAASQGKKNNKSTTASSSMLSESQQQQELDAQRSGERGDVPVTAAAAASGELPPVTNVWNTGNSDTATAAADQTSSYGTAANEFTEAFGGSSTAETAPQDYSANSATTTATTTTTTSTTGASSTGTTSSNTVSATTPAPLGPMRLPPHRRALVVTSQLHHSLLATNRQHQAHLVVHTKSQVEPHCRNHG